MNNKAANIFLHFLNKDTQDIFGLKQDENQRVLDRLRKGFNASILLCKEYCFIPLGFYFESKNTRRLILDSLVFIQEGLLRICIRETDIQEYLEKKKSQLQSFASDIDEYQGFYKKEFEKKLVEIDPMYLRRNVRVGDYCIDKWVQQHRLFFENDTGDMHSVYGKFSGEQDALKITVAIKNVAEERRKRAFIWKIVDKRCRELGITDSGIRNKLRLYFEKYYYEAYLEEYDASLLYDFYLIDLGIDFELKNAYPSSAVYSWFAEYIKCLGISECLELIPGKIVELRYMPEFIQLMEIYNNICIGDGFSGSATIRSIVSRKRLSNEDNINELAIKVREYINNSSTVKHIISINRGVDDIVRDASERNGGFKEMESVLVLSALEKELEPVLKALYSPFMPKEKKIIEGRTYYEVTISNSLKVICTTFMGMGQVNAAIAVKDALKHYEVDKIILTGICGGIDRNMKYGDIIISDQIVDYELAKTKTEDEEIRWEVYRSDFGLLQSMKAYKSERWTSYLKEVFPDPKFEIPDVYAGIVLSGNKVIANHEKVVRFQQSWHKALAVEMEASGVAASLWQMKEAPSFIMVKSICDFADAEKNDDWQEYASSVAASFVVDYILNGSNVIEAVKSEPKAFPIDENQKLFSAIKGAYNKSELKVLAFNIGVDMEEIDGTGISEVIVEFIKYCKRRNITKQLVEQINKERNNLLADYNTNE